MPIITSLLDTDYYKFTQMQFVYHQFPDAEVEYTFKCRTPNVDLSPFAETILEEIYSLCCLTVKNEEIEYLRSLDLFKDDYLNALWDFRFTYEHIEMTRDPFTLKIKGTWFHTILFETPILAIISEIYSTSTKLKFKGYSKLGNKIGLMQYKDIKFADFGTRRRHSFAWQDALLDRIKIDLSNNLIGTSNMFFAMEYNLQPIGTMAHEALQAGQVLAPSIRESQRFILEKWLEEYKGKLGIALTDIIGMDAFLRDFDCDLAIRYQGCRQDSGNPFVWGDKLINHYEKLGIDPKIKTAVFSDGLTFEKAIEINDVFKDRIKCVFGIGTNLTNDVGIKPLQIVIKMTKCNGKPVAKISDSPGKGMCEDQDYLRKLKWIFDVKKE